MSSEQVEKKDYTDFVEEHDKYLMLRLGKQVFGVLVDSVEDVLFPYKITEIPLSPPEIMGMINLRGRVVTAIDLGSKLGFEPLDAKADHRSVVIEKKGHFYSLVVNKVSEVIDIPVSKISSTPDNLSEKWKKVSVGVYSLDSELMVILDAAKLIDSDDDIAEVGEV